MRILKIVVLPLLQTVKRAIDWVRPKPVSMQETVRHLVFRMLEDPEYYYSWQANIAMCTYDSFSLSKTRQVGRTYTHQACNEGAIRFLDSLIYSELANHPHREALIKRHEENKAQWAKAWKRPEAGYKKAV